MEKVDRRTIIFATILAGCLAVGILVIKAVPKHPITSFELISASELAQHTGTANNSCWVAVDTTVYLVQQGYQWREGEHIASEGQANCGKNLTSVIDKSPHGRAKLKELTIVGTFNPAQ